MKFTKEEVLQMIEDALKNVNDNEEYGEYRAGICFAKGWVKAAMEVREDYPTLAVIEAVMGDIDYEESRS